jgi:hypothetical protein
MEHNNNTTKMDGLQSLSNIAAEMPRLDCSSSDESQRTTDAPQGSIETPESALFRRLSSFPGYMHSQPPHQKKQFNYNERRGEFSSIYPSPLASFNISTGNNNTLALAAQMPPSAAFSTNPVTTIVPTAMCGYTHAIAPFSSTLDEEYYLSQEKIRQVYINNIIAASTVTAASASAVAASVIPTAPIHSEAVVVPSELSALSMMGGLLLDQHRTNAGGNLLSLRPYFGQQQPGVSSVRNHQLSIYFQNNIQDNHSAIATAPMMNRATPVASYAATLRHQQYQNQQFCQPISPSHNTLFLPSDANFLSEAHCFIRFVCIELFTSTEQHLTAGGRGARPTHVGQVGFRCIHCKNQPRDLQANQAVSFPSTRDNIFESVRNFQRVHLESCRFIPPNINLIYQEIIHKGNHQPKRSHKLVRAYYSQAASEMGLIDTPFGLRYRDECGYKQRTTPSPEMLNILEAGRAEEKAGTKFVEPFKIDKMAAPKDDNTTSASSSSAGRNAVDIVNDVKFGKFDALSSKLTKQVLLNARKETTLFVQPQDFPTISDFIFLLFHQLKPCKPMFHKKRRRLPSSSTTGLSLERDHPNNNNNSSMPFAGLCCKHCQKEDNENPNGMYFPANVECLGDSSFSQTLLMHLMSSCPHVPQDIKHALTELKNLAREYKASVKRGSKKKFVEKVWDRLGSYTKKSSAAGVVAGAGTVGPKQVEKQHIKIC